MFIDVVWVIGSLLKPSFPQPGLKHPSRAQVTPEEIALATATLISRSVPSAVPGVVFLSGMQLSLVVYVRLMYFRWIVIVDCYGKPSCGKCAC